jgi:periplasmic divalent cation tolerance protein
MSAASEGVRGAVDKGTDAAADAAAREAALDGHHAVVMTTCASLKDARILSAALLEARLAACVQMLPIESAYIWDGTAQSADEVLLLIKGRAADFKAIEALILQLHPYELPEIIQIPISNGFKPYLAWLDAPFDT